MTINLNGRNAVVTGGASGIGLAIALELARAGAAVILGSRRLASAGASAADSVAALAALHAVNSACTAHRLDVCDPDSIQQFLGNVSQHRPIDILINAAGVTGHQALVEHTDVLWQQIIDTNLTGAFRMTRAVLPDMLAQGWGRIINIGSTAATVGEAGSAAYCASKAGLLGLTRCVALEGAAQGVTCTMISPGWVETDMLERSAAEAAAKDGELDAASIKARIRDSNPQQRIVQPSEIAAVALFLCSEDARGITMENIQVSGGALW